MSLTHDDVERLLRLLETSSFDEMQLETDGIKILLRRGSASAGDDRAPVPSAYAQPAEPSSRAASPVAVAAVASAAAELFEIRAPILGTFYRSPKPGEPPFVEPGSPVEPQTTVCIVEVMKLMNAVHAGVAGEVVEVLASDGELVEFDQPLLRVRPFGKS
jgi:acetyl-CoA carboxylase biotin carboxyl carrier protein